MQVSVRHRLFQKWRLALRVVPVVVFAAVVKALFDHFGWESISLNPLYTGLVAANVFLLGFLLAGTLADYKESEKLPGDLAASLETIADDCVSLHRAQQAEPPLDCLRHLRVLANSVLGWLNKREHTAAVLNNVAELNGYFVAFEPLTQPNYIVRLKQEQSAIRRMLIRIDTIRETSFVGAGYAIAELTTLLLVLGLLLVDINPLLDATFVLCIITFLLVYMLLLIRDLDNPFDYGNGEAGAAEVSLQPLQSLEGRVAHQIEALSRAPWQREVSPDARSPTESQPRVAPSDACVGCYRGDTETGFAVVGDAEFISAALHESAGLSFEEAVAFEDAVATFKQLVPEEGKLPAGQETVFIRLCRDCAQRTGTKVAPLSGPELPVTGKKMFPDGIPGDEDNR